MDTVINLFRELFNIKMYESKLVVNLITNFVHYAGIVHATSSISKVLRFTYLTFIVKIFEFLKRKVAKRTKLDLDIKTQINLSLKLVSHYLKISTKTIGFIEMKLVKHPTLTVFRSMFIANNDEINNIYSKAKEALETTKTFVKDVQIVEEILNKFGILIDELKCIEMPTAENFDLNGNWDTIFEACRKQQTKNTIFNQLTELVDILSLFNFKSANEFKCIVCFESVPTNICKVCKMNICETCLAQAIEKNVVKICACNNTSRIIKTASTPNPEDMFYKIVNISINFKLKFRIERIDRWFFDTIY